jgi:hypothetical protein
MPTLKRIVFFWVGGDISIPSLLVSSIRALLPAELEVVQLSDKNTPTVPGTSQHKAMSLSPSIMVARLQAYASLPVSEPTLYLDADMLVLRNFDLPELGVNEIGVTRRKEMDDVLVHEKTTIWKQYPEFRGKTLSQVMPYIYSFVYAKSEILFVRQLVTLRKAPKRLHEWYGDQVTLKKELDGNRFTVRYFDADRYNRTVATLAEFDELRSSAEPPCIVHFKGPYAKQTMFEIAAISMGLPSRPRA